MGNRTKDTNVRAEESHYPILNLYNSEWPFVLRKYKEDMKANEKKVQVTQAEIDKVFQYTNSVKDWESSVEKITYVEKTKLSGLIVYVQWKNGLKSIHHSSEVYSKCPQQVKKKKKKNTSLSLSIFLTLSRCSTISRNIEHSPPLLTVKK